MITETIIDTLKQDKTLQTILGVTDSNAMPVQASFSRDSLVTYLIGVEVVTGETEETGHEHGLITLEIYVKASVSAPIAKVKAILLRINQLLDLKGSSLNGGYTEIVYRLRKIHGETDFDETLQAHVGLLSYEFYTSVTQ